VFVGNLDPGFDLGATHARDWSCARVGLLGSGRITGCAAEPYPRANGCLMRWWFSLWGANLGTRSGLHVAEAGRYERTTGGQSRAAPPEAVAGGPIRNRGHCLSLDDGGAAPPDWDVIAFHPDAPREVSKLFCSNQTLHFRRPKWVINGGRATSATRPFIRKKRTLVSGPNARLGPRPSPQRTNFYCGN
jgi:hypothetical protein